MSSRSRLCLSLAIAVGCGAMVVSPRAVRADDDVQLIDLTGGVRPTAEELRRVLPYLSNNAMQRAIAISLGLTEVAGRPVNPKSIDDVPGKRPGGYAPASLANGDFDHMISGDITSIAGQQHNASVAVNPVDQSIVVVVTENTSSTTGNSTDCSVYISFDGGASYTYSFDLGIFFQAAPHSCVSPKTVYSPDGANVYFSSFEVGPTYPASVVDNVQYNGFTFAGPGGFGTAYAGQATDTNSIGVHTWDAAGFPGNLYTIVTNYNGTGCYILEITWGAYLGTNLGTQILAQSPTCINGSFPGDRFISGPTIAAGPGTQVLACWFDSGIDGYSTGQTPPPTTPSLLNKFNIACRSSNDRGVTFAGDVNAPETVTPTDYTKWIYAAKDVVSEVPLYVGPNYNYFSIKASEYPTSTIDHTGTAHLAFSYGIAANRYKTDNTNAAYIQSTAGVTTPTIPVIYSKWSPKVLIAGGAGDQLFPTVVSQKVNESAKPYIYVAWIDTGASSKLGTANANLVYDARYRLSTAGGKGFGPAKIVSDHASLSDFNNAGNYLGAAASQGIFHFVWTDNRFSPSKFTPRLHIFGERY